MTLEKIYQQIETLEKSENIKDLFLAMDLIVEAGDESLLNNFLLNFKERLYKADPIKFIGTHVNFYVLKEKFLDSLEILHEYQEAPFINLTTDDFMKELEGSIKKYLEPTKNHKYDIYQAEKDLYSNNEDCLIKAISYLSRINIRSSLNLFRNALLSPLNYYHKILLQFILIEQAINEDFVVVKDQTEKFTFNPSKTLLPFDRKNYLETSNYIKRLNETPSVIKTALELLNTVEVRLFPKSIIDECHSAESAGEIFIFLAKKYLMENPSFSTLVFNTQMSETDLNRIISRINSQIN